MPRGWTSVRGFARIGMGLVLSLLGLACRKPEASPEPGARIQSPLVLRLKLPEGADRMAKEAAYREALVRVLTPGLVFISEEEQKDRDPVLEVNIQEMSRSQALRATVADGAMEGIFTGANAGKTLAESSSNPGKSEDLALSAIGAGAGGAIGAVGGGTKGVVKGAYHDLRLGYRPKNFAVRVSYAPGGGALASLGATDAWAVVQEMKPMSHAEAHDVTKLRREEARALAAIVARMLRALRAN